MMQNYLPLIDEIKSVFPVLEKEIFNAAPNGTHHKVFLSSEYVIRFRDDNPELLAREVELIKQLSHPLIPKVLWVGKVGQTVAMVERRLSGETIDMVWKDLSGVDQANVIEQIVQFLLYLKSQSGNRIYSVATGRVYADFPGYLTESIDRKVAKIKRFEQTGEMLKELLLIIDNPDIKSFFVNNEKLSLVHGDLIIHNLLTDGKNLTGVLDWELALFGDCDYDLFRLFYYQECARAYQEQGIDETFESDYMDKLVVTISGSGLIEDKELYQKKYRFARATFYINALDWAANSDEPEKNLNELIVQWNKKRG